MKFAINLLLIAVLLSSCSTIVDQVAEDKKEKIIAPSKSAVEVAKPAQNTSYIQSFLDKSNGWKMKVLGQGMFKAETTLYKTKDGGLTWERISDSLSGDLPSESISGILFTSSDKGWITVNSPREGEIGLHRTDNGGKNWKKLNLTGEANSTYTVELPVFFSTTHYGLLRVKNNNTSDETTLFYVTEDHGDSWKAITDQKTGTLNKMHWEVTKQQNYTVWEVKIGNKSWTYNGKQWMKKLK